MVKLMEIPEEKIFSSETEMYSENADFFLNARNYVARIKKCPKHDFIIRHEDNASYLLYHGEPVVKLSYKNLFFGKGVKCKLERDLTFLEI